MGDRIAIVVPVLDDWESFAMLVRRIGDAFVGSDAHVQVVAVDDGSLRRMPAEFMTGGVAVLRLATNLGHQRAIAAGLAALANRDETDFVLHQPAARVAGYGAIVLAGLLKFYPAVLLGLVLRERLNATIAIGGVAYPLHGSLALYTVWLVQELAWWWLATVFLTVLFRFYLDSAARRDLVGAPVVPATGAP